jgi:superfamily II DNA or RNA helicase
MKLQLRDYQSDIISQVYRSMMQGHHKPLVVAPCGSGKTVIFAWMARQTQLKQKTVWFLVHRRELLDQTFKAFEQFSIPTENIHIGMVATVANHPERWPDPDLIIFDEGHHASAATWRKITDAYPSAWIIGLTATPCRLDGKPLGAIYDDLVIGVSTNDLIEREYLAEYRYYAPAVADLAGLGKRGSDYDQDQASEILMKRAVYGDVVKHWKEYAEGLQTICYCSSIKHSQAVAEYFRHEGIEAVHFDGDTAMKERTRIVDDFRAGQIRVLCNCDLISEGFDIPDCWCCILLRPTMSTGLFIQQSGRALRPQDGKTAILLDHVGNYTRHGLPSDDREWSLVQSVKPRSEYNEQGELKVRQCVMCYYTFKTGPTICPKCGAEVKQTRQEIKNIEDVELKQITEYKKKSDSIEVSKCRSYADFKRIEIDRGYRPGWAWIRARQRGYKI